MSLRVNKKYNKKSSILEIHGNGPTNFTEFIYILKGQQQWQEFVH